MANSRTWRISSGYLFLVALLLLAFALGYLVVRNTVQKTVDHQALSIAQVVASQAATARTVYSREIAEKLRRDGPTMSEKQQQDLTATVNKQREQYENLARPLDEQIRQRQTEERNRILGMIKAAIDVVAEREKFDVVLNANSAVFAKPEYDISEKVIEQVGKAN